MFEECQDRLSSGSAEQAESSQAANLETRYVAPLQLLCQPAERLTGHMHQCQLLSCHDCPAGVCHRLVKMQQTVLRTFTVVTQVCLLVNAVTSTACKALCRFTNISLVADHCMIEAVPMADQHILESNQDSTIEGHHLEDMMAVDPSEVCSPVKHTPASERPAEDGFHRTFMPFDMLRSPTSLGGQSFQTLNAHLAQNARLSTRQRNLRHDLRTATKEYVPEAGEHTTTICS